MPAHATTHRRLLTFFTLMLAACNNTPVTIAPPRVPQGGRATSISVASDNARLMAVTSETGGLFRTYNGGASWQHLDGLPNYNTIDVAIAPSDHNTIIATTAPAYRTPNDGGIWRSTDVGSTWRQDTGWAPKPGPDCPSRPGAHAISNMPLSRTFYVGTDCGVALSIDNGANWSHFVLDTAPLRFDSLSNSVRSILVINRTLGVAVTPRGMWHLTSGGVWAKSQSVATSTSVHAFASPFWNGTNPPLIYYASSGQRLWVSSDGGNVWSPVPAPSVFNREAFVRVARSLSGDDNKFELWYGDGRTLNHQTMSFATPIGDSSWNAPVSDHADPSDIAFDLDRRVPTLLATDGGVHATPDSGKHWKLIGIGYGGYEALQINEITGQSVGGSSPHLDLYYSTQDNDLKASPDGGSSWPSRICCEGRYLQVQRSSIDKGTRFTADACAPCGVVQSAEHFENASPWPNAPDGNSEERADAPFLVGDNNYLQSVVTDSPITYNFFRTTTGGGDWTNAYSFSEPTVGPPVIAGGLANPTMYHAVRKPGALPNFGARYGLERVTNVLGSAVVRRADSIGFGAIGALRTPLGSYPVVSADPRSVDHLIAADVQNGEMVSSANGGLSWQPLPALTQAVTDSGRYLFTSYEFSFASVIAWDPYDSCHILVGTMQNGVIRSIDGGNTWARIAGSKSATYISSFFFPPTGQIWMATVGRGLWTMSLDRHARGAAGTRCEFPGAKIVGIPIDTIVVIDPNTGAVSRMSGPTDTVVCSHCTIVAVHNGWITRLDRKDDAVKAIAISGGTIFQMDRAGREVPLQIANSYLPGDGRLFEKLPRGAISGRRRVRGLIFDGSHLVRLIASSEELPFVPRRTPRVFVRGAGKGRGETVVVGDSVRVMGTGFLASTAGGKAVQILFDGELIAGAVPVSKDGSFSLVFPNRHPIGELLVTATQQDGRRTTTESASIRVIGDDRPEEPEK